MPENHCKYNQYNEPSEQLNPSNGYGDTNQQEAWVTEKQSSIFFLVITIQTGSDKDDSEKGQREREKVDHDLTDV